MIMLQQMIILFLIMLVGVVARKKEIITDESSKKLSSIVVNISNPCFIISSVLSDSVIEGKELIITAIIALISYAVLIIIAGFLPIILKVQLSKRGVYRAMIVFTNMGFMGFPIVAGIYGSEALLYGAVFMIPFNVLIYTYGVYVMAKDGDELEEQSVDAVKVKRKFNLKLLINPGTVAVVIALVFYAMNIHMPYVFSKTIDMIGGLTAPLSMMVIGASFIGMDIKSVFTDIKLIMFSVIKLLIVPILFGFILKLFITNQVMIGVTIIMIATPVGSMVPMLASQYGGDVQEGTKGVAVTTIFSVITLSIVSVVLGL